MEIEDSDGSYTLQLDPGPGEVNIITGKVLATDSGPAADSYSELSDGSQIDVPFAVAPLNPDGSFELLVPANQVGITIPSTEPFWLNAPLLGGTEYTIFFGGTTPVTQPVITLPTKQIPNPSGSGSGCSESLVLAGLAC